MKRSRIGLALAGMVVCAAACALLWPHAREAAAILSAQDDPAELADLQLDSALRNNQAVVQQNIEAALAAGDADLADSFVDLAREKNIALDDELSRRGRRPLLQPNTPPPFPHTFPPSPAHRHTHH